MSIEKENYIITYVEIVNNTPINAALEVLTQAREIADIKNKKVLAILIGEGLEEASKICINYGADEVICVNEISLENEIIAKDIIQIIEEYTSNIILLAATSDGKDIGAMLASSLKTSALTDVIGINPAGEEINFTIPMYSGNILKEVKVSNNKKTIAILRSGLCKKQILEGRVGNIQVKTFENKEAKAKIVDIVKEISENVNLEEAEIIVSGGRGMGSKENFELVEKLAEVLGGVVGATRPVTEENWIARSHQIGQSGKIVAPKLYIACGVSGATQHISGAMASNYIVAINKDEDASIFDVSDLGIVGNAIEILPLMIEEIKKIKTSS
ncbi:MAG: electron transfer flavoprotein subunit alpha/FixB family protein [Fusobacterium sp.]|nr:electron transfer flavoprotein subunit alpha/FixB family protein [Fusobacterium sp.]